MTSVNEIINNQMADAKWDKETSIKHIPIEQVDELAEELVTEYENRDSWRWYCGVINKFGVAKVKEWQRRAKEGNYPGRLFTTYVNQAGGYKSKKYE